MYESPIHTYIENQVKNIQKKEEGYLMECVHSVGISVDKEELLKALIYDRSQYEKGFRDGLKEDRTVHAHWKKTNLSSELFCSDCGACFRIMAYEQKDYLRCPHCGAIMDEEVITDEH